MGLLTFNIGIVRKQQILRFQNSEENIIIKPGILYLSQLVTSVRDIFIYEKYPKIYMPFLKIMEIKKTRSIVKWKKKCEAELQSHQSRL